MLNRLFGLVKGAMERWHPRRRSHDYRRSARNAVFNAGEGVVTPLLWVLSAPIFIKQLGTDHFGIWMLVNSAIGAGGLLSLGLTDATTKYVSKYRALNEPDQVRRITRATFLLYIALGGLGALVAFFLAPFLADHVFKLAEGDRGLARAGLQIGGLGILARFVDNVFFSVLQGFERYDLNARVTVSINAITTLLNVGLVLSGRGLTTVLATTVSMIVVGSGVKAMVIRRRVDPQMSFTPYCSSASLRELLGFGFYTWIQRALGLLASYMDRFLIAAYAGMTEVAYYTVCLQLVSQVVALLNRGGAFLFPFTASLQERGDRQRLRKIYNQSQDVLIILTCSLLIPVYLCSGSILRLWMGGDFAQQSALILSLLCLRFVFAPLSIVNANFLMGMGLVKIQAALVFMSSSVLLTAMFVLIPVHGALGAALAQFSLFPFILINRYVVDRKLFDQLNAGKLLAFYLPVLLCLALASLWAYWFDPSGYSLGGCIVTLLVAAGMSGGTAWTSLRLCRRLGFIGE